MEHALHMQGLWPLDMMEPGIANIKIDKEFKGQCQSEDEGPPFGETFEQEAEVEEEVEGRMYHAAGNKRARVAGAFGAASSSSSHVASPAGTDQEALAADTKANDEAYKSPDGWAWLKTWKAIPDASHANSIVFCWRAGMEDADHDDTGTLMEPLG
jgi:hypothetical protein